MNLTLCIERNAGGTLATTRVDLRESCPTASPLTEVRWVNNGYCGYMPNQGRGVNRFERAFFMPMTDFQTYPDAMPPI